MKYRFTYSIQQKPRFTKDDAALFSDERYDCKMLYLTQHGDPVTLKICVDHRHYHWCVNHGFSSVVFLTRAEALDYCSKRFFNLNGKPLSGRRV